MMLLAKTFSTCFGIGYIQKGAGTVAALFLCLLWSLIGCYELTASIQLLLILIIFFIGIIAARPVESIWGHDSNRVVIDEVLGMAVALFIIPFTWYWFLAAFILFRFFDILKPIFIKKAELLPSSWGVMSDDLLAGIYSNLILQIIIQLL